VLPSAPPDLFFYWKETFVDSPGATSRKSLWKNPLLYSGALILCVAAFVLYIMLERYLSQRAFDDRILRQENVMRQEADRRAIEQLGGSELAIRSLYLAPSTVRPGETTLLCYDVANAKTVTLEPPVAEVWPSHSRCIALKPKKSTTFTLTIADASGKTVSQSVELKVN
jgi:hypothetical protein